MTSKYYGVELCQNEDILLIFFIQCILVLNNYFGYNISTNINSPYLYERLFHYSIVFSR